MLLRAGGSVRVGSDAVPDNSKGYVAPIFRVKQTCWSILKLCMICCIISDVTILRDLYFVYDIGKIMP